MLQISELYSVGKNRKTIFFSCAELLMCTQVQQQSLMIGCSVAGRDSVTATIFMANNIRPTLCLPRHIYLSI